MFNAIEYFTKLCEKNKLCKKEGFHAVTISSPDEIDGLNEEYRDHDRFVCVADTGNENLASDDGEYGFEKRRAFNVSIVSAFEYGNMDDRQQQLELCREVFRQFVTRIIRDKFDYAYEHVQFETQTVPYREYSRLFLSGMTGLYFTLYSSEPIDMQYDDEQWTE